MSEYICVSVFVSACVCLHLCAYVSNYVCVNALMYMRKKKLIPKQLSNKEKVIMYLFLSFLLRCQFFF